MTTRVTPSSRQPTAGRGGVAQAQELGVGGGVAGQLPLVVAPGHDLAVDQGDGADGDVTVLGRGGRLLEGQPHGGLVVHARRSRR